MSEYLNSRLLKVNIKKIKKMFKTTLIIEESLTRKLNKINKIISLKNSLEKV